jgi:hypothetical protein
MTGQLADLAWGAAFFSQGRHKRSSKTVGADAFQAHILASLTENQIRSYPIYLKPFDFKVLARVPYRAARSKSIDLPALPGVKDFSCPSYPV